MKASLRAHQISHSGDVVQLVQLTDTHLCASPGGSLLGLDTDSSLQAVVDLVASERPEIDLLLGTGDLSDQGAGSSYERFLAHVQPLATPTFWLAGNHDCYAAMEAAGNEQVFCNEIRVAGWQFVMLDSQVPGQVGGELGAEQLALLDDCLARAADDDLHSLICLHHQPVAIGCAWLDQQMVADADAFFAILDRYPGAKAVLWGHIHQRIDRRRNGLSLMSSPSTCVQFAPNSEEFKLDDLQPGYRWLELHPDGSIVTDVSRVADGMFEVDLDTGGYL